jgi:hypothetical protein
MMVKIDYGQLRGSVYDSDDGPQWTEFLNRHTGEIIYFCEDAESWAGRDAAIDFVFDCAQVESDPLSWVQIPKIGRWKCPRTVGEELRQKAEFEAFVGRFLRENDIKAVIV